ncbi:MAG: hypothetical protein GY716_21520 [bacterium]|nr:hypothetical protein [bacterium]
MSKRWSTTTRVFLGVGLALALVFVLAVGVTGATIYRAGSIDVDVAPDDGDRLSISVPAGLVDLALGLVPSSIVAEASCELGPILPAVRDSWAQLESSDDFVLVDFSDGRDHVRVQKHRRQLEVVINDGDEHVAVSVPIRTVRKILDRLDRQPRVARNGRRRCRGPIAEHLDIHLDEHFAGH